MDTRATWETTWETLERNDIAKWAPTKGDGAGQSARVAVGAEGRSVLDTTPLLSLLLTQGLIVALGDLTWLVTLISAHSISQATSFSLHPLTRERPNPQILHSSLTFSTSPVNLVRVLLCALGSIL